jgi:FMN reductase
MTASTIDRPLSVVGVSGSTHSPSKTTVLVRGIVDAVRERIPADTHLIEVDAIGPLFAGATTRDTLPAAAEDALDRIESADLLVVASPVYRASYTGLFKHVFDFVEQHALVGTPVLLAATGGSERHGLMIDHQLRPLFSFFQSLTLPHGVYACDRDFTDYRISATELHERISTAVDRAIPLVQRATPEVRSAYF